MRTLVTGHAGYIGCTLVPVLRAAGHDVVGLDTNYFDDCTFGTGTVEGGAIGGDPPEVPAFRLDVRDVRPEHFEGFDAVVHLAALSNDPLGDLNPRCTFDINHRGSFRVAAAAKAAGVTRFLQSSSCSLYGAHGDDYIDESAEFRPVTPYGEAKVLAERDVALLADDDFSPTFLRNATAYGMSPRLRGDLVVNNLTGYAFATGEVFLKSDGSPWRPLVHVQDISSAFLAALEAPREVVHGEAFNVGATKENYQISEVAEIVEDVVEGSRIVLADSAGPDPRNYRVRCDKIADRLPGYQPVWTVRRGVEELAAAYAHHHLTRDDLVGPKFQRIARVRQLLDDGRLDAMLRWQAQGHLTVAGGRSA